MSLRVLFYPQPPRPEAIVTVLCERLGYDIVVDPGAPHDCAFFWTTRTIRRVDAALARLARRSRVLNLSCNDIGKRHVDRVFRSVFGYGSLVDPRRHQGVAVRKSNLNAQHDGRVVRCPARTVRRTCVYQRLIDNSADGGFVEDLRTPVFAGEIPFIYVIRKPIADRFGSPVHERLVETRDVFTTGEMDNIRRFAAAMGLDYAELDVLRDAADGRIFIVDANPTPWGPTTMAPDEHDRVYSRLAKAFEQLIRSTVGDPRRRTSRTASAFARPRGNASFGAAGRGHVAREPVSTSHAAPAFARAGKNASSGEAGRRT